MQWKVYFAFTFLDREYCFLTFSCVIFSYYNYYFILFNYYFFFLGEGSTFPACVFLCFPFFFGLGGVCIALA